MSIADRSGLSVVWTRGKGCSELAKLLASGAATRISGDLIEGCVDRRADFLVTRRFPSSFDLVNVAVPVEFQPASVTSIVATVSGGPHSRLAAQTADVISQELGVPGEMVSAAPDSGWIEEAGRLLEELTPEGSAMKGRVVEVSDMGGLVESVEDTALLVLGAPGGSWLQRLMFGPGARLRRSAQAGSVVVRSAPRRVFKEMGEPVYVSPLHLASDTLRVRSESKIAVASEGRLVGLVRRDRLKSAGDRVVADIMDDPVSIDFASPMSGAAELFSDWGAAPVPVIDAKGNLVGSLTLPTAESA